MDEPVNGSTLLVHQTRQPSNRHPLRLGTSSLPFVSKSNLYPKGIPTTYPSPEAPMANLRCRKIFRFLCPESDERLRQFAERFRERSKDLYHGRRIADEGRPRCRPWKKVRKQKGENYKGISGMINSRVAVTESESAESRGERRGY